ncbi:MAG: 4-hydroxy-tetrahydrodipicolinate synthase [Chlamydiales bacterium]|jgi:4-hydroxy-tetrahydrodipicolinate synthase|nr:4-hydroxy-tetrahydrodipicolinate synthase [Chlamydiales bacterium]
MPDLTGLFTALITPFDAHGNVDLAGMQQNIEEQLDAQVDGIVVLGTTGESPTLSFDEKKEIIRCAKETIRGQVPLIVGAGSNSTASTLQMTQLAEELRADAALLVTPYYNRPMQEGLYRHFAAVAEQTSIPLILYNIPKRAGQTLEIATLKRLSMLKNVVAIKESSGDISFIADLIAEVPDLKLLSGDDNLTLPIIAFGGRGLISVLSNLLPRDVNALVKACLKQDFALAKALHLKLHPFMKAAFIETNPGPIKFMMQQLKKAAGPCRLPLSELSETSKQTVLHALNNSRL